MDSSPAPPSSSSSPQSTPTPPSRNNAAEQARLRKERREAKIKAGGSARLGKITSMGGRPAEESISQPPFSSAATPQGGGAKHNVISSSSGAPDPEEVDISRRSFQNNPSYGPARGEQYEQQAPPGPMGISEEQIRQIMAQLNGNSSGDGGNGNIPLGREQQQQAMEGDQDPMTRLLHQLLRGGDPTASGGGAGGGGLPPPFAQMMGQAPQETSSNTQPSSSRLWWQIIHLVSSLTLGIYVILTTSFTGSRTQRITSTTTQSSPYQMKYQYQPFYLFSTLELILQSTRYFLQDQKDAQSAAGFLIGLVDLLPPPWRARVLLALRYAGILRTVVRDGMVVLFVLGLVGWLKGGIEA